MALSKVDFNNINVTPAASKALKWNASANGFETGDLGGNMVLLSTQTASSSANLTFASGIDSTYKEYMFKYINIHASNDDAEFNVNFRDGSTAYDATKTSTNFFAYHTENDGAAAIQYGSLFDLAQGTGGQNLAYGMGTANDECCSGTLHLFDPSNTTFVKHFISENTNYQNNDGAWHNFVAGYCNVTAAIDGVQFSMSAGNIDAGTIKMYGIL
jgi:hypothetical protein